MATVVQRREIPDQIRSLSGFNHPDYGDAFTITATESPRVSAQRWAHVGVDDAAGAGGQLLWKRILGLRLLPRNAPGQIGGWKVGADGANWVRLEAASWFLAAHLVFYVDGDQLSFGTFIRYDRPIARPVWAALSHIHRRVTPGFLRRAASNLASKEGAS
jgi:hypothetical protein